MLDAAIELIVEQGASVSMMAIGQRSGFSHGLVLSRFGSKAGLNEAVAREAQRRFSEIVDAANDLTGAAKLHRMIDIFFKSRVVQSRAFYVLLGAALGPDPQLRDAFAHADRVFRRYVQAHLRTGQEDGEIDSLVDVKAAATLLVGMLRGVAMQYWIDPDAFGLEAISAQAHSILDRLAADAPVQQTALPPAVTTRPKPRRLPSQAKRSR